MTGGSHDYARYSASSCSEKQDTPHRSQAERGAIDQEGVVPAMQRLPDAIDGVNPSSPPTTDPTTTAADDRWDQRAACRGLDPELFFPMQGPTAGETVRQAKQVCWNDCPVRQECEDYGVEHELRFGVFGGWTVRERRKLRLLRDMPPGEQPTEELTLDLDWDDDYPQSEVA